MAHDQPDYLQHLAQESARFREAILLTDPADRVPTCPDWDADDLLWHLAEVQWFWGTIADQRLQSPDPAEEQKPERPGDRAGLLAFFDRSSALLHGALRGTGPDTAIWTWAEDHSVGFVRRRQAHEALVHRLDAELTAGERTEMATDLGADGVDEVLRVMYGGEPDWGTFTPTGGTVRVEAVDTGRTWVATLGRFSGTSPDGETSYEDEPDLRVAAEDGGQPVDATVSGAATDLDCWLWHRPPVGEVERGGNESTLAALDATLSPGIN